MIVSRGNLNKIGRVAAVVLTFHPRDNVVVNILQVAMQVDVLFIVNNEFDEYSKLLAEKLQSVARIFIINSDVNLGVAAGFNKGLIAALEHGFEYFILFDQDSMPLNGMVDTLKNEYLRLGDSVGIIGPRLQDKKTGRFFDLQVGTVPKKFLISSGSFFSKELIDKIGLLDEQFFIDYVDHEYCLRSLRSGKLNFQVNDAVLCHEFGDPQCVQFFGRKVIISNYSPLRHYYMSRNRVLLFGKYGVKGWLWKDLQLHLRHILKIFLLEENKFKKACSIMHGYLDGFNLLVRNLLDF